jgi:hypothetical protein
VVVLLTRSICLLFGLTLLGCISIKTGNSCVSIYSHMYLSVWGSEICVQSWFPVGKFHFIKQALGLTYSLGIHCI